MPEPRRYITDTWGENWIPAADAADHLGVSLDTVHRWSQSGRLEAKRVRDHWLYVRWDDVLKVARELAAEPELEAVPEVATP